MSSRTLQRNKRKTAETRKVEDCLRAVMPEADVEAYRYNSAAIRVRVVSTQFDQLARVDREEFVLPILRKLPDSTRADIILLLLLTPSEHDTGDDLMDVEFDDPTPSNL